MHVVYWGTYDNGKPRNRIMQRGLRENGVEVHECHRSIWHGVEDKSQIKGSWQRLSYLLAWLVSYPLLVWRYLQLPKHQYVIVGYLGHLDILVLWPFAKMRRVPLVWDAFISLYDTLVVDRQLAPERGLVARFIKAFERLACRAATLVLLDTEEHAAYFRREYGLTPANCKAVFVGAEPEKFPPVQAAGTRSEGRSGCCRVLFYGQFIPLHGIATIVEAAELCRERRDIEWLLIGSGQEDEKIARMLVEKSLDTVTWHRWVPYEELQQHIHQVDICLGIFGRSHKASRVIPNKVYQILSCGKPLITRDSPAIRELLPTGAMGVRLVTAGDAKELAGVVQEWCEVDIASQEPFHRELVRTFSPRAIGRQLLDHLAIL